MSVLNPFLLPVVLLRAYAEPFIQHIHLKTTLYYSRRFFQRAFFIVVIFIIKGFTIPASAPTMALEKFPTQVNSASEIHQDVLLLPQANPEMMISKQRPKLSFGSSKNMPSESGNAMEVRGYALLMSN